MKNFRVTTQLFALLFFGAALGAPTKKVNNVLVFKTLGQRISVTVNDPAEFSALQKALKKEIVFPKDLLPPHEKEMFAQMTEMDRLGLLIADFKDLIDDSKDRRWALTLKILRKHCAIQWLVYKTNGEKITRERAQEIILGNFGFFIDVEEIN